MKPKLLCILHQSPPAHGAAKVGDFIASSNKLKESFDCRFITIRSSETIGDIGKINFKKLWYLAELFFQIVWVLLVFRPDKIYFTASVKSVAFYRDLLLSIVWKTYKLFKPTQMYYHYHTKGVDDFVSVSEQNLTLTRFFLNDVNLILLSPLLEDDFKKVKSYKKVFFLPNGVFNPFKRVDHYNRYILDKFQNSIKSINALYLSNMIKSKGYFEVLKFAKQSENKNIHFHFAGGWQENKDEEEFFNYIEKNQLQSMVTFHGFINGKEKHALFKKAHIFIFPTRYVNEAFPLSVLESLSYGVPVIATDEGSIPYILDEKSGVVLDDVNKLLKALEVSEEKFLNVETAQYCRERYLNYFTVERFEQNLITILKEQ